jgi:hypothetical protein
MKKNWMSHHERSFLERIYKVASTEVIRCCVVSSCFQKYFPLFFLALTPGHLDTIARSAFIQYSREEREKGISH